MSTTQEVREFFRTHLGVKMDNSQLREQLGTDDGNGISQALNLLHGNGEISRERRPSGTGWQYWAGAASRSEPIEPRLIKGSATSDNNELPPEKPRAAKKAKAAKPAKTKRKYTRKAKPAKAPKVRRRQARSAPPQEQTPPTPAAPTNPSVAVFAIRQDGEIGIDHAGKAVSLPREEVQRLQAFLNTVSQLWS